MYGLQKSIANENINIAKVNVNISTANANVNNPYANGKHSVNSLYSTTCTT
jgi:hypothetical protein